MSSHKLSNVSLQDYRLFLQKTGCKITRTKGGHEHWTRNDLNRPITVQTHVDPVPEFIIRNALRALGMNKQDFFDTLFGN
jgi:predicted RNA binding protein YcfA (HicA-like mRNA interferase family)